MEKNKKKVVKAKVKEEVRDFDYMPYVDTCKEGDFPVGLKAVNEKADVFINEAGELFTLETSMTNGQRFLKRHCVRNDINF